MKSRITTYMLLAAAVAIWGVIAWRLLAPADDPAPLPQPAAPRTVPLVPQCDTLAADYPDPFLKPRPSASEKTAQARRTRPAVQPAAVRETVACEHMATITVGGKTSYVVSMGDTLHEVRRSESVAGFVVAGDDGDSLYLNRNGIRYGVRLCE